MSKITWDPDEQKPPDAEALEAEIGRVAPGAAVRIMLRDGEWFVRALAPAAFCARGTEAAARDVSLEIAQILSDWNYPARVFPP